jgi:hypothetical protein
LHRQQNHNKPQTLSHITTEGTMVKLSSKLLFFTNYKQISTAQHGHQIVAVVKMDDPKRNLVWRGKLTEHREKLDMVVVCTHTFVGA